MLNQFKFFVSSKLIVPQNLQRFSTFPSNRALKRKSTYPSLRSSPSTVGRERRPLKYGKSNAPPKSQHKLPVRFQLSHVSTNTYQFIKSFDDFDLHPQVLRAIKEGSLAHVANPIPTPIQSLAIDKILRNKVSSHIVYAAETGSGKTLAYLVPIVEALKREDYEDRAERKMGKPRALILVPTHELVQQVLRVLKAFSHIVKLSTISLTAKIESKALAARLENPVDVVVGTPTAMLDKIKNGSLSAGETKFLVIDEADSLLEETKDEKKGWGEECRKLVDLVRDVAASKGHEYKIIVVTATLPKSINNSIEELFGGQLTKITTPALHKPLPNLKVEFVNLKLFNGNRRLALLQILKKSVAEDDKVMVFCNRRNTVEELHASLAKVNINTLAIYKNGLIKRSEALRRFQHDENKEEEETAKEEEEREDEEEEEKSSESAKYRHHNIIICTDLAARGIDTMAVNHVILYDFPTSVVDYLHRVGRTARTGSKSGCRATALIGNKDKMLADRIQRAIRQNIPLTQ